LWYYAGTVRILNKIERVFEMRRKLAVLALVALIGLLLVACGSASDDVPSLRDVEGAQPAESATEAADSVRDNEAAMMALTQCLRDQGIKVYDPVVDAEGNVGKPEFAEGVDAKGEDFGAAWEACEEHLEGFTFGKERANMSEQLDQFLSLATCLRDMGYDVDEPTAETLDQWLGDFKEVFNWKDPTAMADYEECASDASMGGGTK
jgi:hypothetical protein